MRHKEPSRKSNPESKVASRWPLIEAIGSTLRCHSHSSGTDSIKYSSPTIRNANHAISQTRTNSGNSGNKKRLCMLAKQTYSYLVPDPPWVWITGPARDLQKAHAFLQLVAHSLTASRVRTTRGGETLAAGALAVSVARQAGAGLWPEPVVLLKSAHARLLRKL